MQDSTNYAQNSVLLHILNASVQKNAFHNVLRVYASFQVYHW
jgi:hypothetical protein